MYLIFNKEHFNLLFTNRINILVRLLTLNMKNCLTTKIRKCATLLKMQKTSLENATPSSGISPLASYKEVPLPPGYRRGHEFAFLSGSNFTTAQVVCILLR